MRYIYLLVVAIFLSIVSSRSLEKRNYNYIDSSHTKTLCCGYAHDLHLETHNQYVHTSGVYDTNSGYIKLSWSCTLFEGWYDVGGGHEIRD
ncbi:hypothetical protein BCR32DRAFT_278366 [Anaeromyces robustus]|uniref:Uncharacterized protein n=1 Tax=Anaeromyces robustus TaxID=1754192 RepID=A0A1Y1XBF9_9FUNG|nr:hypothetical protein BCR32DRAFT_278366 [Anaeromyces robustus]|eukprot:ORX83057.1 hypothetical protein BCR32DRAFT_278366 [Anaeromyces robustus]